VRNFLSGATEGCPLDSLPATNAWVPHISLVFREMWDTTASNPKPSFCDGQFRSRFVVSHISRKTSEIWGTRWLVEGTEIKRLH
jgi:hypothetical protein